jgi:hypothetical protein
MADSKELELLARLLYTENQQNLTPEEAAGIVRSVYERQKLAGYPESVEEILNQPRQYSGFSPAGGPRHAANYEKGLAFSPEHPRWNDYMTLAQHGWQEAQKPGEGPTFYFSGPTPKWAKGLKLTTVGAHTFGREKRRKKAPK